MSWNIEVVTVVVLVGTGATVFMDVFGVIRARFTGQPGMNWAMVGRWLGHLVGGRAVLASPASAAPVPAEKALGWVLHYGVGVGLAGGLTLLLGPDWLRQPPAVLVVGFGAISVALPMLTLQPGLGLGVAARLAPNPWKARRASLLTHFVFGVGLYLSALLFGGVLLGN